MITALDNHAVLQEVRESSAIPNPANLNARQSVQTVYVCLHLSERER